MTEETKQAVEEIAPVDPVQEPHVEITLGGETLVLITPKGRAGRRFITYVQDCFTVLMEEVGPERLVEAGQAEKKLTAEEIVRKGYDEFISGLKISGRIFQDESLHFEDEVLPGFYMFSTAGLSKKAALQKCDELSDTPSDIASQFMTAAMFWISPEEGREAIEAAAGKSENGKGRE